jgi:transposase-like protein
MDIDYLEKAGALLFGDNWIVPMSRALGINRRTIYKWRVLAEVPDPVCERLKELMVERRAALKEHERGLRRPPARRSSFQR